MKYIIAKTIKQGNEYRHNFAISPKSIRVICSPNSLRGKRFTSKDMLYVLTDNQEIWRALEPALQGAPIFCYNLD